MRRTIFCRQVLAKFLHAAAQAALLLPLALPLTGYGQDAVTLRVVGDGIPQELAASGNAARGRTLLLARDPANCILCHGISDASIRFAGNLAPPLDGAGARNTAAQLRLRIADSARLNPETIMPSYHRTEGLTNVAGAYRGKPILTPQQVEDLLAFLLTLK